MVAAAMASKRRRKNDVIPLFLHEGVEVRRRNRVVEIGEGALLLDLLGGFEKAGHGRPIERGGEADALDARGLELGRAERAALYADHEVERLAERTAHLLDGSKIG